MPLSTQAPSKEVVESVDQRVTLHGVSWSDFELILAVRGDAAGPRITYLHGELELMSPSRSHEGIKKKIARLLEAYAEERGLDLNGFGAWTVKSAPKERGVEPDECYILGEPGEREQPDLAIEVVWTSGGIDKLEVYRGLGVGEVWFWIRGQIEVHVLRGERYERRVSSELLPDLDLGHLASFLDRPSQTQAVREYRASVRRA